MKDYNKWIEKDILEEELIEKCCDVSNTHIDSTAIIAVSQARILNFIEEKIKQRDLEWEKKVEEAIPKKSHCELCDFPQPECDCRGVNRTVRLIRRNLKSKNNYERKMRA